MANDANRMTLRSVGAAQAIRDVTVTLGTGVGGGILTGAIC